MIVERLDPNQHDRTSFDCGESSLNLFLQEHARQYNDRNLGVTWIAYFPENPRRIVGYYTISMHSVLLDELGDSRLRIPHIPVVLLGRLAIDRQYQGQGVGTKLLLHAFLAANDLSKQIGAHAIVVDPLNAGAIAFYQKFDFLPMPGKPERLCMTMKHLSKTLAMIK